MVTINLQRRLICGYRSRSSIKAIEADIIGVQCPLTWSDVMYFLIFVLMLATVWLLWNISRNTGDALDKQTAIQYELVSLEKKLEQLSEKISPQSPMAEGESDPVKKPEAPALKSAEAKVSVDVASVDIRSVDIRSVDINSADIKDIVRLPKIGKALGRRIIEARPYSDVEALMKVQGISRAVFEEIKGQIRVS